MGDRDPSEVSEDVFKDQTAVQVVSFHFPHYRLHSFTHLFIICEFTLERITLNRAVSPLQLTHLQDGAGYYLPLSQFLQCGLLYSTGLFEKPYFFVIIDSFSYPK